MGWAKVWWTVDCARHGTSDCRKGVIQKRVKVGQPKNKRRRLNGGCPLCKQELVYLKKLEAKEG